MNPNRMTYYFKKLFLGCDEGKMVLEELKTMVNYDNVQVYENANKQYYADGRRSVIADLLRIINVKENNE